MSPRVKLATLIGGAILLASVGVHCLVVILGIQTEAGKVPRRFGEVSTPAQAVLSGSSLTFGGVDWRQVAGSLRLSIESWPVPGSSPAEWEQLQRRSPEAKVTFVGVSLYDLNETWLCEFRANIVPVSQTLADLRESGSDPAFAMRLMNYYPLTWMRTIFPTAGRADRVIFGIRDKARSLLRMKADADDPSQLRLASDYTSESRLSDWPKDRVLRRLASMRRLQQGQSDFLGPKHLALRRLLLQARRQGAVVVIVFPVSPPYIEYLLTPGDIEQFEASLADVKRTVPETWWVRLDRLSALASSDYFYDPVHLNMQGRRIASQGFLRALAGSSVGQ